MRILHTSDWHLGRTFHGRVLDDAHAAFADHLVELVAAESVDAVLISGDVYDRAIPPNDAVTLLDETLRRLTERTRVVLTPGNHDSARRLGFAADLMREGLIIRARTAGLDRGIILPDADGNDAAIVLADADWEAIVPVLFWAAFGNSGQWCIATKRIYVHESIHAAFVKAFVAFAKTQKVGDGMSADTDLGPIQNRMQYGKLLDLFRDVKEKGYQVALGGTIDESLAGNFVPVTIIDNPPEDSRIVQEEPFGPILPILSFQDVDEAVAKANDSPFGLAGSVWGRDRNAAIAVAKRLETGTVWVNEIHIHGVDIPFGGHKQSGMGVENGQEGLAEFTNTKTYMFHK